jgi:hypothetical protein
MTMEKVKRVRTDGLKTVKDGRRGLDRGTKAWWTIHGRLAPSNINKQVYMWR